MRCYFIMGKHYDNEFKNMVLSEYKKGTYGGRIPTAKHFGIPEGALGTWIKKERKQGSLDNDINHNRGRKKEEDIDYKERYEILKKYQAFLKAQREKK